jgi:hypothetical protein
MAIRWRTENMDEDEVESWILILAVGTAGIVALLLALIYLGVY